MTQQDKIREMSEKKLLNNEQKKVLFKIFSARIESIGSSLKNEYDTKKNQLERDILNDPKQRVEINKLVNEKIKCDKRIDEIEREARRKGFSIDYHNEINLLSDHKELVIFDGKRDKVVGKINDLKTKLLADIYGLPMTYAEMNDYIEKEIAKIEELA